MKSISQIIQESISSIANAKKALWLENYIKHDIKSIGVGIPDIRRIIKEKNKEYSISDKSIQAQIEMLNDLMNHEYTEFKIAAILYIQLFWADKYETEKLRIISSWFDKEFIFDWNVCDWLCVRILSPMVDKNPKKTIEELKKWNTSDNLWKARASLVPFAQCKTIKNHFEIINNFSTVLIKRDERFCKTAVGWVLREISKHNTAFVEDFLSKHEKQTSKEVVKNATKYLKK